MPFGHAEVEIRMPIQGLYWMTTAEARLWSSSAEGIRQWREPHLGLDTPWTRPREWLSLWAHEIHDMAGIGRVGPLVQLAAVPGIDEELDGAP